MKIKMLVPVLLAGVMSFTMFGSYVLAADKEEYFTDAYKKWRNGPPADPNFFMFAVWAQEAKHAAGYQKAGINTMVNIPGATAADIETVKKLQMYAIAHQSDDLLSKYKDEKEKTIIAWGQRDEPDNVKKDKKTGKLGSRVPESEVINNYKELQGKDSSRPCFLNVGCGLVDDSFMGRGKGAKLTDYIEYFKGADLISFDVYPVSNKRKKDGENYLWWQALGQDRMKEYGGPDKIRYNCMETTSIGVAAKATPLQVKAEVWISILHGSRGIIYFCHQFFPEMNTKALLDDSAMLSAVGQINKQIAELAPVINLKAEEKINISSSAAGVPVEAMAKKYKGSSYIFAVPMKNGKTTAKFTMAGIPAGASVEVLGEGRTIKTDANGSFEDSFVPWAVHLYKIAN